MNTSSMRTISGPGQTSLLTTEDTTTLRPSWLRLVPGTLVRQIAKRAEKTKTKRPPRQSYEPPQRLDAVGSRPPMNMTLQMSRSPTILLARRCSVPRTEKSPSTRMMSTAGRFYKRPPMVSQKDSSLLQEMTEEELLTTFRQSALETIYSLRRAEATASMTQI